MNLIMCLGCRKYRPSILGDIRDNPVIYNFKFLSLPIWHPCNSSTGEADGGEHSAQVQVTLHCKGKDSKQPRDGYVLLSGGVFA